VIHFFVNGAIAELALLRASEEDVDDRVAEFWDEIMRLRDLLKFEFFFADKEVFRAEIEDEILLHDRSWKDAFGGGAEGLRGLIARF